MTQQNKDKNKKGDNIKMVTEVKQRNVELLVHTAYLMGFIKGKQYQITNPEVAEEIKILKEILVKDISKLS